MDYEWCDRLWRLPLFTGLVLAGVRCLIALMVLDRLANQGKTRLPWGITAVADCYVGGAFGYGRHP